jgi:hypothetical protein
MVAVFQPINIEQIPAEEENFKNKFSTNAEE